MSYQTYITEALVINSFDSNTADKSYLLFTKTAGMLYATARSVREERSKQRFALQNFGLITASLIKGKGGWRIGSVQSEGNFFTAVDDKQVRGSVVRVSKWLRRFVVGEEPHPGLYEEILVGLRYLLQPEIVNRALVEEVVLARLLYTLGYIAKVSDIALVFESDLGTLLETSLPDTLQVRLRAITDTATTASHL